VWRPFHLLTLWPLDIVRLKRVRITCTEAILAAKNYGIQYSTGFQSTPGDDW
jgi:hypothetical protein